VLAGRALADTATQLWGLVAMTIVSFLIGFRLEDGVANGTIAVGLIMVYLFAFEWVFITLGLYAGSAQTAQAMSIILVPIAFVSSAYVPVESMPSGLRAIAEHQPMTYMVDAVRTLAGGARAEALLGHPASYFISRSLIWSAAIVLIFAPIAIARYRRG
jgi:ABC-type multidrug transport system permease subunit